MPFSVLFELNYFNPVPAKEVQNIFAPERLDTRSKSFPKRAPGAQESDLKRQIAYTWIIIIEDLKTRK